MLHFLWLGFKFKSNKTMTTKHMAQRGEHRSAIGLADDFRSVTITPCLSPRRYFTHPRRIRQVQVGPKWKQTLTWPNTPRHYELKSPAIVSISTVLVSICPKS